MLAAVDRLQVRFTAQPYDDFEKSPWSGLPSPSIDAAWHHLLEHTTIRVTAQELARSNQTSVELPEGGGYMAWLGVFHELHCIVRVPIETQSMTTDSSENSTAMGISRLLSSKLNVRRVRRVEYTRR